MPEMSNGYSEADADTAADMAEMEEQTKKFEELSLIKIS